jgi:hypothetical protein
MNQNQIKIRARKGAAWRWQADKPGARLAYINDRRLFSA